MALTIADICDGIGATLVGATGIESMKSYDELTEGVPSLACLRLHVYPDSVGEDVATFTDRTAFAAGVQQSEILIFVDHYARQRSQMHLDMKATVEGLDALQTVLEAQERKPFFGVTGIKSFKWSWKRAALIYGDAVYAGGRFSILVRVF